MRRGSTWVVLAVSVLGAVACTSDDAEPVDLDSSGRTEPSSPAPFTPSTVPSPPSTSGSSDPLSPEDQNARSRRMAREYAEQQCFDDPAATEGVIRIVDPVTDQVVASVVVDCDEVRSASETGVDDE